MTTQPHSKILISTGLLVLVAVTGCETNKCNSRVRENWHDTFHAVPQDTIWHDSSKFATVHQCMPHHYPGPNYGQPIPQVVPRQDPRPNYPNQPTTAPMPETKSFPPPPVAPQTTLHSTPSRTLMTPPTGPYVFHQFEPYRSSESSIPLSQSQTTQVDPVAEPPESHRRLVPKPITAPKLFKPVGRKIRSMFDTMRNRLPGRSVSESKTNDNVIRLAQKSRSSSSTMKSASRRRELAAQRSNSISSTGRFNRLRAPIVALAPPEYTGSILAGHPSNASVRTHPTRHAFTNDTLPDSCETRLPQTIAPAGYVNGTLPKSMHQTDQSIPMWPYAPTCCR